MKPKKYKFNFDIFKEETRMEKVFLEQRGNLIEKICACNNYEKIADVLKLYLAKKTLEQLKVNLM